SKHTWSGRAETGAALAGSGQKSGSVSKGDLLRGEPLDDDHRPAADRTNPEGVRSLRGWRWGRRRTRVGPQQLLAKRHERGASAVGEKTGRADADEPARKRVQQKASQELLGGQGHQPAFVAVRIVFPAER